MICAHLFWFYQIAAPCRHNDIIDERDSAIQERDSARQELQASNERIIVLSQQLGVAQDSLGATESSCNYFQAQLQQVRLPLCSAGQHWARSLVVASGSLCPGSAVGQRALAQLHQSRFAA